MRCNYRDLNTILRLISKASIDNKDLLNITLPSDLASSPRGIIKTVSKYFVCVFGGIKSALMSSCNFSRKKKCNIWVLHVENSDEYNGGNVRTPSNQKGLQSASPSTRESHRMPAPLTPGNVCWLPTCTHFYTDVFPAGCITWMWTIVFTCCHIVWNISLASLGQLSWLCPLTAGQQKLKSPWLYIATLSNS